MRLNTHTHTHIAFVSMNFIPFVSHDSASCFLFSYWIETLKRNWIATLVLESTRHALGSALRDLKRCSSPASSPQWCEVTSNSDSTGSTHSRQCVDTCRRVDLKHSWWWSTWLEMQLWAKNRRRISFLHALHVCGLPWWDGEWGQEWNNGDTNFKRNHSCIRDT